MKAKQTYRVQKREKKCTFAILKIEGIWGGGSQVFIEFSSDFSIEAKTLDLETTIAQRRS